MNIEMNSYMVYLVKNEWIYDFLMNSFHYADFSSRIFREIAAAFCKKRLRTNYKPETDIELDWQFFREFTTVNFFKWYSLHYADL